MKFSKYLFNFKDKPTALPYGEWRIWHKNHKAKYPIRYFLFETIPDFFDDIYRYWRNEIKYPLLYRYHPRYKFHIIKTQLSPGYYDPDIRMMESMFALLCEFVEYMEETNAVDWDSDEPHQKAWNEMKILYNWWHKRKTREEDFDKKVPYPKTKFEDVLDPDKQEQVEVKTWNEIAVLHNKQDEIWVEEDSEMMKRLIDIRQFLWYP